MAPPRRDSQVEEKAGALGSPDATCLLRTGSDSLADLAAHLCFLPWDFEVLDPTELRDAVVALADRLHRAAGVA